MYEYRCKVIRVIDGDTVDVDIDLGFGIVLKDERVRIMGIDTPESRTRDKVEKLFGLASKARLKELIDNISELLPKNASHIKEDFKDNLKILLNDYLRKADVVTREEFDVQSSVLAKTREKLDNLEDKLNRK